jgi:NAD(P)-dependent dehydrogenase (short-subunit alcohol dehydrogenase family)
VEELSMPGAVIIGAGPGIGQAVARRLAREGLPIALIARSGQTLGAVADAVAPSGVPVVTLKADSTDEAGLNAALDKVLSEHGVPDVAVYNAALVQADALLDQQYGPSGVHVASVTVDGPVAPGTDFDPNDIAEHYWRLHIQPRHLWDHEALHAGRS